jgi:HAD superfamily hydrolase (TIGR01509 family)
MERGVLWGGCFQPRIASIACIISAYRKNTVIKNIIWDVDGTLFDTYPAIAGAFRDALLTFGNDVGQETILSLAKLSLDCCLETLAAECHLKEEALARAFDAQYTKVTFADQPPFPGAKAVCESILAAGGRNVIVTHRGREGTAGLLEAHGMAPLFAGWITRDDGHPRKPDPAAFEAALRAYDLSRAETLAVGDREIDVLAGKAAGLRTCLFRGEDARTEADLSIHQLDDLLRYLQQ